MFSKIFTGLFIVAIACCLYGHTFLRSDKNDQPDYFAKKVSLITSEGIISKTLSKESEKDKLKFLQFIYQLTELSSISSKDTNLWLEAKQYFPQTEQFENHNLSLQYISPQNGTHLIFYEFRQTETTENSRMFLANFGDQGAIVDQLKLKDISFDGTLSINLVGTDIIEVEYIDFFVKNHFKHADHYIQKQDVYSKSGYCPIPEREVVQEKIFIEYTEFEYYKIGTDKQFQQLSRNNITYENRSYPQAANRIISNEELLLMKLDDLELMCNEIYASYGFIFPDESWSTYFSTMHWYTPSQKNVVDLLSDVERINIAHILAITKKDYSLLNR